MAKPADTADRPGSSAADHLLSPGELAAYLSVPLATIYRWRYHGKGPVSYRVGRHVRYKLEEVEAWLERRREHGTAAAS